MSNISNYGLIILTPPLNPEFMCKYQIATGLATRLSHPLHISCPYNQGKRQKPSGKKTPLKHGHGTKFGNIVINHASQHNQ